MRLLGKRGKRNGAPAPEPAPRAAKPTREPVEGDMVRLAGVTFRVVLVVWYGRERYIRLERAGLEGWREVPATWCELGPEAGGLWEGRAG